MVKPGSHKAHQDFFFKHSGLTQMQLDAVPDHYQASPLINTQLVQKHTRREANWHATEAISECVALCSFGTFMQQVSAGSLVLAPQLHNDNFVVVLQFTPEQLPFWDKYESKRLAAGKSAVFLWDSRTVHSVSVLRPGLTQSATVCSGAVLASAAV